MKKYVPWIIVLLLLFRSTALCQSPLGISYNNGSVTVSLSNGATGQLDYIPGLLIPQTTTNLSRPITWTDLTNGEAGIPATNPQQFFRAAPAVPLFEFEIFYNLNLETAFAQTFFVTAPVFSNGGIWSGSTSITFASVVSGVGMVTNSTEDPFCSGYSGSGLSTYLAPGQPTSNSPPLAITLAGTNSSSSFAESLINLPPANYALGTAAAYSRAGSVYFANEVDVYLTNTPTGTNWGGLPTGTNLFLYYQDPLNAPNYLTWVTNDFYALKAGSIGWTNHVQISTSAGIDCVTNVRYAGYSFLTNVLFWDWREGWNEGSGPPKAVQAVQLDLIKFNAWLANLGVNGGSNYNRLCQSHNGRSIDSIYLYNAVPLSSTVLPAVRVVNGAQILEPFGFTLATAQPLYVRGDYNVSNSLGSSLDTANVVNTEPTALIADSITVLSDNWTDANSSSSHASTDSGGGPIAATTEINAACIAGIVPSIRNAASDANGYSGGVENYFRLLENWSSSVFFFNGSIVALYPSRYATNCWQQTGGYYTAPTRKWAYDTNFNSDLSLPPLTPTVANYVTP